MSTPLLPWPHDAVMLVCAAPDEARRDMMESANPARCRHCGCDVLYDSRSYRKVQELERKIRPIGGNERPVDFFCLDCYVLYDWRQCGVIGDQSGGKDDVYADPKYIGRL